MNDVLQGGGTRKLETYDGELCVWVADRTWRSRFVSLCGREDVLEDVLYMFLKVSIALNSILDFIYARGKMDG